jgi:large subunit ribosomal protein L17
MRHAHQGRKLNRTPSHRMAMFRNMVTELLEKERVETTEVKAKEVRRLAEKMITLGKRGDLHSRRQALAFVRKKQVVKKLFDDIAARYANRNGGYTRIIKTTFRKGDAAPMAIIELVEQELQTSSKPRKSATPRGKKQG